MRWVGGGFRYEYGDVNYNGDRAKSDCQRGNPLIQVNFYGGENKHPPIAIESDDVDGWVPIAKANII